jgi:hypothetical protein
MPVPMPPSVVALLNGPGMPVPMPPNDGRRSRLAGPGMPVPMPPQVTA